MRLNVLRIKVIMAEKELTQNTVAEEAGFAKQSLSLMFSKGKCSVVSAGKIAKALKVPVSDIILED